MKIKSNIKTLLILALVTLLGSNQNIAQNVGIGAESFTPDSSAMLEVKSTDKGFLPPRMTTVERYSIQYPAEGLWVFDLDINTYYFWGNGFWWKVCSLKECPGFSVTAGSNSPVIAGSTINLNANVSGGTSPYTYNWSGPSGFTSSIQNPMRTGSVYEHSGTYNVEVTDASGCIITGSVYVQVITVQTFNFTGSDQTFSVPSGVTSLQVKAWGAGGGGGGGGGAAFVNGNLAVTQGQVLTVVVGGTCNSSCGGSNTYGGGGKSSVARGGGGRSAIRINGNSVEVVTAGGGGGSGSSANGGAAGGITGNTSTGSNGIGTSSCPDTGGGRGGHLSDLSTGAGFGGARGEGCGSNAPTPGGQFFGGDSPNSGNGYSGGGGGSGYYGGGGGRPSPGSGGGGGCSYYNQTHFTLISSDSGSGATAGGSSDPDRGTAGNGANHGRIVIIY